MLPKGSYFLPNRYPLLPTARSQDTLLNVKVKHKMVKIEGFGGLRKFYDGYYQSSAFPTQADLGFVLKWGRNCPLFQGQAS